MLKKTKIKPLPPLPSAPTVASPAASKPVPFAKTTGAPLASSLEPSPVTKGNNPRAAVSKPKRSPRKTDSGRREEPSLSVVAGTPGAAVNFALLEPEAKHIYLAGDFNGWSTTDAPLIRQGDGVWTIALALAPGRYEYKFVVDGEWRPDLRAQDNVFNAFGTLNSVITV